MTEFHPSSSRGLRCPNFHFPAARCFAISQRHHKLQHHLHIKQEGKTVHKYYGVHPYLIVSNNVYNENSGQCEVIPFTTKRWNSRNPVHVDFGVGEVDGLPHESTLVIEGRDTLLNSQLSEPIGTFSDKNWQRAANAMVIQCPMLAAAFSTNLVSAS